MKKLDKYDIIVKAYVNIDGLGQSLVKKGIVKSVDELRKFWHGFVGRRGLFDVVDVGYGKEKADHKIRGKFPIIVHCDAEHSGILLADFPSRGCIVPL